MAKKIDEEKIIGKYGKLEILSFAFIKFNHRYFNIKCECGNIFTAIFSPIINRKVTSCIKCKNITHGMSRSRLYKIYDDMKKRCYNENSVNYKFYGAKNIIICKNWLENPKLFFEWALKNGYNDTLTIDRINSYGNYTPDNCRFVAKSEQPYNLRNLITNKSGYKGISWSKKEKRWLSIISINNRSKRIGSFKNVKEACEARNKFIIENNLKHQMVKYEGESNPY